MDMGHKAEGTNDEVKRPEGPPPRSRDPEDPWTSKIDIKESCGRERANIFEDLCWLHGSGRK